MASVHVKCIKGRNRPCSLSCRSPAPGALIGALLFNPHDALRSGHHCSSTKKVTRARAGEVTGTHRLTPEQVTSPARQAEQVMQRTSGSSGLRVLLAFRQAPSMLRVWQTASTREGAGWLKTSSAKMEVWVDQLCLRTQPKGG